MSFQNALREQIARQSRELVRFLTRRVGAEDAPDLAQEAVLRVLRHAESGDVANPTSLLHATAANLAKDLARRRRTESKYLVAGLTVDELAEPTALPVTRLEAEQSLTRLFDALDTLTPRRREVFMMRRFENLHQEEIARRLGISRNMVEKHLRAAFKELKQALE